VAGATGGLGAPVCRLLAAHRARLSLVARSTDRLADLRDALAGDRPDDVMALGADLRDPTAAGDVVAATRARFGRLDGLVFAAGVAAFGPLGELSDRTLEDLFSLNTFAPIRLLRAALGALEESARAGGPAFAVHLSAVLAEQPVAGMAAYGASKAALASFDAAAARELRRVRVRLVDVRPPHTETGLATRPLSGQAPALPPGLDPAAVAARIVRAVLDGERDVPSTAFGPAAR
jgi:cyclic-di-GMP-binding biofilm dispersal mediator protein